MLISKDRTAATESLRALAGREMGLRDRTLIDCGTTAEIAAGGRPPPQSTGQIILWAIRAEEFA